MNKSNDFEISPEDLLDLNLRLECGFQELEAAHSASVRESFQGTAEHINQRIEGLKLQLLEESNKHSRDTALVKISQLGQTLLDCLYPNGEPTDTEGAANNVCVELNEKELDLVLQVKRVLKETCDLEYRLDSGKTENMRLKNENSSMMAGLKNDKKIKNQISNDLLKHVDYLNLKKEISKKKEAVQITKNITQLVIQNCGVDLLHDETYRELLIKCGEPFNT